MDGILALEHHVPLQPRERVIPLTRNLLQYLTRRIERTLGSSSTPRFNPEGVAQNRRQPIARSPALSLSKGPFARISSANPSEPRHQARTGLGRNMTSP